MYQNHTFRFMYKKAYGSQLWYCWSFFTGCCPAKLRISDAGQVTEQIGRHNHDPPTCWTTPDGKSYSLPSSQLLSQPTYPSASSHHIPSTSISQISSRINQAMSHYQERGSIAIQSQSPTFRQCIPLPKIQTESVASALTVVQSNQPIPSSSSPKSQQMQSQNLSQYIQDLSSTSSIQNLQPSQFNPNVPSNVTGMSGDTQPQLLDKNDCSSR